MARIRSAPSRMATSTGSGSDRQPSSSQRSPTFQGSQTYGMAILARTASRTLPSLSTTRSPVMRSVATMWSGIADSSKLRPPNGVSSASRSGSPCTMPKWPAKFRSRGKAALSMEPTSFRFVTAGVHSSRVSRSHSSTSYPSPMTPA